MQGSTPEGALLELVASAGGGRASGVLSLDADGLVVAGDAQAWLTLGHPLPKGQPLESALPFLEATGFRAALAMKEPRVLLGGSGLVRGAALVPAENGFLVALLTATYAELAFTAAPSVALVVDAAGRVVEANRRALELFRGAGGDPLGSVLTDLIPSAVLREVVRAGLAGHEPVGLVAFEWARPEGRRTYEFTCTRIDAALVVTLLDVTESRRLAAEREKLFAALHQSQKLDAIGQLASGVAHDMNNVLAVVQTCAGALRDEVSQPLHKADAEQILLAAQRARDLLHQLLAFSRKTPARRERFDLVELVREGVSLVSRLLPASVKLTAQLPTGAPPDALTCIIEGDRSQLQQTVINVCLNARDAMPHGGSLTVAVTLEERRAFLTVTDTGAGMNSEVMERALEPFFTTKPRGSGTGLGLSMAYTALRAHGGDIRLESSPGKGTRVSMWLPRQAQPNDADHVTPITANRGVAVVVDDDQATRAVLGRFLKKLGYAVHLASSGEEALTLLRGGLHPSLVVCDLVMPGLGGTETLSRLRAIEPAISVVITSGFLDDRGATQVREAGATGLLRKPFSMDDVVQMVAELKRDQPA